MGTVLCENLYNEIAANNILLNLFILYWARVYFQSTVIFQIWHFLYFVATVFWLESTMGHSFILSLQNCFTTQQNLNLLNKHKQEDWKHKTLKIHSKVELKPCVVTEYHYQIMFGWFPLSFGAVIVVILV